MELKIDVANSNSSLEIVDDIKNPSFLKIVWKEIKADPIAFCSLFLFIVITLGVFIWTAFLDNDLVTRVNLPLANSSPGGDFLLGTDNGGRDMVSMMVIGARNSLMVTFGVTIITSVVGLIVGVVAGFYGGNVDNVIMRIIDIFSMFPTLMIIIVAVAVLGGHSVLQFILIMSLFLWIGTARTIRSKALQQGNMDYAHASKTLGTPNVIIIFREVMPNLVSIISVNFTLNMAANMGLETGLTFLGFGLPFGTPSLGALISLAQVPAVLENRVWQWLPPALFILLMMLCINFIGQAMSRAADAKQRMG